MNPQTIVTTADTDHLGNAAASAHRNDTIKTPSVRSPTPRLTPEPGDRLQRPPGKSEKSRNGKASARAATTSRSAPLQKKTVFAHHDNFARNVLLAADFTDWQQDA